jgi:RND family efflux transporter MFP subunit
MSRPDPLNTRPAPRGLRKAVIVFLGLCVGLAAYGLASRAAQNSRLRDLTESEALPNVAVESPSSSENQDGIDLPGRLQAFAEAPIYARVPGYLKAWRHDIGTRVKAGEVLAEIETPDLDQQLMQARAELSAAEANAKLAEITAKRWQSLAGTDAVAKQDVDQRTFTWNADIAQVKSAQANVDRLVAEAGFKRLVAPFDGIITARETDVGALINAGAAGGAALFVVSETRKLRVYVSVPQTSVPSVPAGTRATIRVPEHPGAVYLGTVEASAQAVTPSTGTTLMQIIVDNTAGDLMPGEFASIHLDIKGTGPILSVSSSALIFDARGLSVATVGADNRVLVKPVTVERDLGGIIEIASGLAADDRVIQNPPDGILTGALVNVVAKPKGPNAHG